jgi:hypothetical protein
MSGSATPKTYAIIMTINRMGDSQNDNLTKKTLIIIPEITFKQPTNRIATIARLMC